MPRLPLHRALAALGLVLIAALAHGRCDAAGYPFSFTASYLGPSESAGEFKVGVDLGGRYDTSAVAVAHLLLPPGLDLVSGDTLIRFRPGVRREQGPRTIVLRPQGSGTYRIQGQVAVNARALGVDEAECELEILVSADSVQARPCRILRQERVKGSQRFRYAGAILVPIDGPESFTEDDILLHGVPPKVLRRQAALVPAGVNRKWVHWVVYLGPRGRVIKMDPVATAKADSMAVRLTRSALQSWTFAPAKLRGKEINDYLLVAVPLEKQP